jgi:tRNA threonylcarbamoyladenosine biosynthesis protein TsaB
VITLAIETSTSLGSVALLEDGRAIFSEKFTAGRGHGAELFASLERARSLVAHCDKIAVGLGPGSYSGVRIAIASTIGLEFGLGGEVLGLSSILAFDTSAREYIAIGDARRHSFYFARIAEDECAEGPLLLDAAGLENKIAAHNGLPVFASAAIDEFPNLEICFPSAKRLARLAELGCGIFARGNLEPIYLRPPHITQPRVQPK